MEYPKAINDLVESFSMLPGIGKKTALRLALHVYSNMSEAKTENFANALLTVKKNVVNCKICGNLSEDEICPICSDKTRDQTKVMVVETVKDLYVLEALGVYKGLYHVLNGAIDFSLGIGVDDINIKSLIERAKKGTIKEIILACNATLEGETTSRYIKALLDGIDVKITRIAHGIPVGGDLSYADQTTVLKALEGRRDYNE